MRDYTILIALLAGTVTVLRLVSLSDRRAFALAGLAVWVAALLAAYTTPSLLPAGLQRGDLDRLAVTVAIWVGSILVFELSPSRSPDPTKPAGPPSAQG